MKKSVYILIILIALLIVSGVSTTLAWLTDTSSSEQTFTMGSVSYTLNFTKTEDVIVPGQNLLDTFSITNNSNVDSHIRFSITIDDLNESSTLDTTLGAESTDSPIIYKLSENSGISYEDGYFYYGSKSSPTDITTSLVITPLSSLSFNGEVVGNDYSNHEFRVTIVLQAKQAEYVTWNDLGSISFETGI